MIVAITYYNYYGSRFKTTLESSNESHKFCLTHGYDGTETKRMWWSASNKKRQSECADYLAPFVYMLFIPLMVTGTVL